ncbi:MAG: phospholipase D-like domain-containing protein [Bacteroidota bacterium]
MKIKFFIYCFILLVAQNYSFAQSVKVYFNHPVNTNVANGNYATYLNGTFDDTIVAYINRANYTLDIAVYNFTSSTSIADIAQAVNNAYNRGVQIRWIYNGSSSNSGLSALNNNIPTLGSPTSQQYGIMHNKFMVIDINHPDTTKTIVLSGSCNWTDQQFLNDYNNIYFIQSKSVAQAFEDEFNEMWGSTTLQPNLTNSKFGPDKTTNTQHIFTVDGHQLDVYFSPSDNTESHLIDIISAANTNLNFGIYAFTRSNIADSIVAVFNRGVYVAGIMDNFSSSYAPKATLAPFLMNQLLTFSLTYIYHNKFMIADACNLTSDPTVGSGSFNWSLSANTKNDENLVIFHNADITNQFYQSFYANAQVLGLTIPSCSSITSINETYSLKPILFPNPVTNEFKIENIDDYFWEVKSLTGQLLHSGNNNNTSISNLNTGVYLLEVKSNNQQYHYRLVKQ